MRIVLLASLASLLAVAPAAAQQPAASDIGARPEPVSVFGYPPVEVDQRAIVRLLKEGRFDDLERQLQDLEDATRADITREMDLISAYRSFYGSDASIGGRLDEWVTAFPGSDAALVARAQYWDARAWVARGEGVASAVDDWRSVGRAREAGEADVARALDLDPDNLAAWATALRLQSTAGWSSLVAGLLDAGLERFPTSYWLRWVAAQPMEPRWGGSYAVMDAMAQDAQRFAGDNPRLATLRALSAIDRSRAHTIAREYDAALAELEAARPLGTDWNFYLERGVALYHANRPVEAIPVLDSAMAIFPVSHNVMEYRARAFYWAATRAHVPPEDRVPYLEAARADFIEAIRISHDTELKTRLADAMTALGHCSEVLDCYGRSSTASTSRAEGRQVNGPWWWQAFVFVVSLPYTLYRIFADGQRLYLLPAPIVGAVAVLWSFREWVRQRFWTPAIIHVMAALALAMIVAINVAWVRAGGQMWMQRYVVIVVCGMFPYVAYLLFLGPKYLGRKHLVARARTARPAPFA